MFPLYFPLFSPGFNLKGAGSKNRERSHVFLDRRLGKELQPECGNPGEEGAGEGCPRGKISYKEGCSPANLHHITSKKAMEFQTICSLLTSTLPVLFLDPHSAESSGWNRVSPSPEASCLVASYQYSNLISSTRHQPVNRFLAPNQETCSFAQ